MNPPVPPLTCRFRSCLMTIVHPDYSAFWNIKACTAQSVGPLGSCHCSPDIAWSTVHISFRPYNSKPCFSMTYHSSSLDSFSTLWTPNRLPLLPLLSRLVQRGPSSMFGPSLLRTAASDTTALLRTTLMLPWPLVSFPPSPQLEYVLTPSLRPHTDTPSNHSFMTRSRVPMITAFRSPRTWSIPPGPSPAL